MDAATTKEIERIWAELQRLRKRMECLLSQAGGHMEGQLSTEAWIQFEEVSTEPDAPASGKVRAYARNAGGVTQYVVKFDDGTVRVLATK